MKTKTFLTILLCSFIFILACEKNNPDEIAIEDKSEPQSGEYFIVNVATNQALTPVDVGVNSNTRLKVFNQSGLQKWTIKKQIINGNIITYTIQNTSATFYLRPYFQPTNGNAIISELDDLCNYSITAEGANFIIKNNKMLGDALYVKDGGALSDEPWFAPNDNSNKFKWKFVKT